MGQEAVAAAAHRPTRAGDLDVVEVAVGGGEEVVVAEGAAGVGDGADRLLDGARGDGPAIEQELGNAGPGVAGVERVADRAQPGSIDPLMEEKAGVRERGKRGGAIRRGLDDVGEVGPAGGGVLVVGEQDVAVGRAGAG